MGPEIPAYPGSNLLLPAIKPSDMHFSIFGIGGWGGGKCKSWKTMKWWQNGEGHLFNLRVSDLESRSIKRFPRTENPGWDRFALTEGSSWSCSYSVQFVYKSKQTEHCRIFVGHMQSSERSAWGISSLLSLDLSCLLPFCSLCPTSHFLHLSPILGVEVSLLCWSTCNQCCGFCHRRPTVSLSKPWGIPCQPLDSQRVLFFSGSILSVFLGRKECQMQLW